MIKTNAELAEAVNEAIKEAGVKKTWLSEKLGIKNQNFNRILEKNNFSIDDANKILEILGYEIVAEIKKKS